MLNVFIFVFGFIVAFIGGMAFTRYKAKRNPEQLEMWYAEAKLKSHKIKTAVDKKF